MPQKPVPKPPPEGGREPLPFEDFDFQEWWGKTRVQLERHSRVLSMTLAAVVIVGAAISIVLYRKTVRERQVREQVFTVGLERENPTDDQTAAEKLEELERQFGDTSARPVVVFRLANVYRRLGRKDDAQAKYEAVLSALDDPSHPLRVAAEQAIEDIERDRLFESQEIAEFFRFRDRLDVHPIRWPESLRSRPIPPKEPKLRLVLGTDPGVVTLDPMRSPAMTEWILQQAEQGALAGATAEKPPDPPSRLVIPLPRGDIAEPAGTMDAVEGAVAIVRAEERWGVVILFEDLAPEGDLVYVGRVTEGLAAWKEIAAQAPVRTASVDR